MKILAIKKKDSAVFQYRIGRPLIEDLGGKTRSCLIRKNDEVTIETLASRLLRDGKVLVIKYIDNFDTLNAIYSARNNSKLKIILDIDDNVWQIPVGNAAMGDPKAHAHRCMMLTESVKMADYVTVSTEPLRNILKDLNQRVSVLPNYLKPSDWKFKRKKHKKLRIGWVYSPTHYPDLGEIKEALKEIKDKYDVEIVIFGTTVKDLFGFPITAIRGVRFKDYPKMLMEAGIDISLAPLQDNDFNKCKSNIKWLESTMAGSAFIGSKVYPYEFSVKHGKTGYLASSKNQWVKYISYLIENPAKRAELVETARKEILEQLPADRKKWEDFYKYVL